MTKKQRAQINKWLSKQWMHDGQVKTMRQILDSENLVSKHVYVQEHSEKRIQLEYKKLASPKRHYCLDTDRDTFREVPKMVWDTYNLPIRGDKT